MKSYLYRRDFFAHYSVQKYEIFLFRKRIKLSINIFKLYESPHHLSYFQVWVFLSGSEEKRR